MVSLPLRLSGSAALPLLSALFCLSAPLRASDTLFFEDFSGDLYTHWNLFGDPLPVRCDSMGLPPPCFDNNGDTMYTSGAISRASYHCAGGLVLESDMYVTSNPRGAWISGSLGFAFTDRVVYGTSGVPSYHIGITYAYLGEKNWGNPHLQGLIRFIVKCEEERDEVMTPHFNDFLDGWHRFRIEIDPDMTVSFHLDDSLAYVSVLELPPGGDSLSIVLGDRSNSWGRVYHDNVIVRRP
ncbi:MAG: hypothetical protein R6U39_05770 [Candidatus Aegiribacteria sp.]